MASLASSAAGMALHGSGAGGVTPSSALRSGVAAPRRVVVTVAALSVVAVPGGGGTAAPLLLARSPPRCTAAGDAVWPSESYEYFIEEMKKFKESRPMTSMVANPSDNAHTMANIAKMCSPLLAELLRKYNPRPLHADTLKDLCSIGRWFMELEDQCNSGYVSDNSIEEAITRLTGIASVFPGETTETFPGDIIENFASLTPVTRFSIIYSYVIRKYPRNELE